MIYLYESSIAVAVPQRFLQLMQTESDIKRLSTHTDQKSSGVSLLGKCIILTADWFRGKNEPKNMDNIAIFRGIFCVLPLVLTTSSVDTENMAAIEIQQNPLKVNTFLEFMADLGTKKANKVRKEDTVIRFTSGGYIPQA